MIKNIRVVEGNCRQDEDFYDRYTFIIDGESILDLLADYNNKKIKIIIEEID
jgi:hypothetical protein